MKFTVTAMCIKRTTSPIVGNNNGYEIHTTAGYSQEYPATRDETIDTETNLLFHGLTELYEIEDKYEAFWNRLNGGYTNREIVKVLNVVKEA